MFARQHHQIGWTHAFFSPFCAASCMSLYVAVQAYMIIFPPLLNPMFWERPGNIPALTRLLVAYLTKAGQEIVAGGERAWGVTEANAVTPSCFACGVCSGWLLSPADAFSSPRLHGGWPNPLCSACCAAQSVCPPYASCSSAQQLHSNVCLCPSHCCCLQGT